MKAPFLFAVLLALATTGAQAGQPSSNNFYPLAKLKPFVSFLGYDRDSQDELDLQTRLQNSGTNWHCVGEAVRLRCPLNGDASSVGSNVYFRAPYQGEGGATLSEFHVTMLVEDQNTLSQLQPASPVVPFLGQDWSSVMLSLGKPTNVYDDGTTVQNLYCAARELPSKAGEPHVARVYVMYVNASRSLGVITSIELAAVDQVLPPLAKPSC
jgi:hypothetical protein